MIDLNGKDPEELLASVRQEIAVRAVNNMRIQSMQNAASLITDEEIEAEISAVRRESKCSCIQPKQTHR